MFGYLNLGDPTKIADTEAQAIRNVRIDRGILEYKTWRTNPLVGRDIPDPSYNGGRIYVSTNYPGALGKILRDGFGVVGDPPGLPSVSVIPGIVVGVAGLIGNPYPPGIYEYLITLFDARFSEEGDPGSPLSVTIGLNQATVFTLPNIAGSYPTKILYWKIYRRPKGGSEFLLVNTLAMGTLSYSDMVPDQGLTEETCESIGYLMPVNGNFLAGYQRKLFADRRFSKSGIIGAFPNENVIYTGQDTAAVVTLQEALIVLGKTRKFFIVYGVDESDFVVKESQYNLGCIPFSANTLRDLILFAQNKDYVFNIGGLGITPLPMIESIQTINGINADNISGKISKLFPLQPWFSDPGLPIQDNFVCETGMEENRFLIWKHGTYGGFSFGSWAALMTAARNPKYLIFDISGQGFMQGDEIATFSYRTKEFGTPKKVSDLERLFIEAEGAGTVNIYLDGILQTTFTFNEVSRKNLQFTVKPYKHHYFSFEFLGTPTTKFYNYGVVD